jgi:tetratricopeptide (TPR) repeat protein
MIIERLQIQLFLLFWIFAMALNHLVPIKRITINKQESAFNLNKDFISIFSLGQKRLISDIIWVQTLIESDLDHYAKNDLNSWMFLRFNTITKLDPLFYENYLYGGQYLAIVKDDILGSEIILNKGVEKFPEDFRLNFHLGYVYAFELQDYKKAQKAYEKIINAPERPFNFDSFYGKVLNQSLGPKEALAYTIESLKRTQKDTFVYNKMMENAYSLKAKIDLECLNSKSMGCDKVDFLGNDYILKDGRYMTFKEVKEIKLNLPPKE